MKTHGRNPKLISAYTALATFALGLVLLDPVHRGGDWGFEGKNAGAVPVSEAAVAGGQSGVPKASIAEASAPLSGSGSTGKKLTIASYTAIQPGK